MGLGLTSVYTDGGRVFVASQLFPELTHLAVGDGTGPLDPALLQLRHEIARTRWRSRQYVTPDPAGTINVGTNRYAISAQPTRFLFYRFRFEEDQAQGMWSEVGLFGGGVTYLGAAQTLRDGEGQTGDDRANQQVVLDGLWRLATSETLTVAVLTAGGSGIAVIRVLRAGATFLDSPVTFDEPLSLSTVDEDTGLTLTFTGGGDGVLSLDDTWTIQARAAADDIYADQGVYNPVTNPLGQVGNPGVLIRYSTLDPAEDKGSGILDLATVVEVIHGASA
jgi:hypothetical protein